MFKAARNYLLNNSEIDKDTTSSYFIECLLFNVPNDLFKKKLAGSYESIIEFLLSANLQQFVCQNGKKELFGSHPDIWSQRKARRFINSLKRMWDNWPSS